LTERATNPLERLVVIRCVFDEKAGGSLDVGLLEELHDSLVRAYTKRKSGGSKNHRSKLETGNW
jgi:hypothetical protein